MKPDLRMSVKDNRRNKNLKIRLVQFSYSQQCQFWIKLNTEPFRTDHPPGK